MIGFVGWDTKHELPHLIRGQQTGVKLAPGIG
jgi:hypothetical protein